MAWTFDAPTGVYRDHALSSQVRRQAAADSAFSMFFTPERGYGRGRGASVTITRMLQLPLAGRVSETERLPIGRPALNTIQTPVAEWGFKIENTEFEMDLTHFDLTARQRMMLRDQMRLTMDKMMADALKRSQVKFVGTAASSSTVETGAESFVATAAFNLSVAHLREIHDYLRDDLKAPPFRNGSYVGILTTKAARGIKNDPEYKDWQAPQNGRVFTQSLMRRSLGMVEGIELYETNADQSLLTNIGTGSVTGEAVFFGDDMGHLATVRDPEIRIGAPVAEDLGRFRYIGWVGTIEAGNTWPEPVTARTIHWGSA